MPKTKAFLFCFWETLTWFLWLFDEFEVKPLFDYWLCPEVVWVWLKIESLLIILAKFVCFYLGFRLESTDVAPKVPHPCPTRRDAGRSVQRGCPRVGLRLRFFFFSDSRQLNSIRADAARFVPNRLRFELNQANSAKIGPYWPYWVVSAGGRYGWNRPKHAWNRPRHTGNGWNRPWIWPKLAFFFLFLWIKA